MKILKILYLLSLTLAIIGSINLGLIAILNIDLLKLIFADQSWLINTSYVTIGLSGVYLVIYGILVMSNYKFCGYCFTPQDDNKTVQIGI